MNDWSIFFGVPMAFFFHDEYCPLILFGGERGKGGVLRLVDGVCRGLGDSHLIAA